MGVLRIPVRNGGEMEPDGLPKVRAKSNATADTFGANVAKATTDMGVAVGKVAGVVDEYQFKKESSQYLKDRQALEKEISNDYAELVKKNPSAKEFADYQERITEKQRNLESRHSQRVVQHFQESTSNRFKLTADKALDTQVLKTLQDKEKTYNIELQIIQDHIGLEDPRNFSVAMNDFSVLYEARNPGATKDEIKFSFRQFIAPLIVRRTENLNSQSPVEAKTFLDSINDAGYISPENYQYLSSRINLNEKYLTDEKVLKQTFEKYGGDWSAGRAAFVSGGKDETDREQKGRAYDNYYNRKLKIKLEGEQKKLGVATENAGNSKMNDSDFKIGLKGLSNEAQTALINYRLGAQSDENKISTFGTLRGIGFSGKVEPMDGIGLSVAFSNKENISLADVHLITEKNKATYQVRKNLVQLQEFEQATKKPIISEALASAGLLGIANEKLGEYTEKLVMMLKENEGLPDEKKKNSGEICRSLALDTKRQNRQNWFSL